MRTGSFAFLALLTLAVASLSGNAEAQSAGRTFRDCPDCPEMVEIPAGTFSMGVPAGEDERVKADDYMKGVGVPQHRVSVNAFALGKYKVTVGEFKVFVAETGYDAGDTCYIFRRDPNLNNEWRYVKSGGYSWKNPGFAQTDRHPVVCLDWADSKAYVAWLSKKTGKDYRLPTEAEWEYAARAGTTTPWFWGDDPNDACKFANVTDLTFAQAHGVDKASVFQCEDGYAYASPVGSFKPNAWDLYDMLGNVWDYIEDCVTANYQGAPSDGSVFGRGFCVAHVIRGSAWAGAPARLRTGLRGLPPIDKQEPTHGLRVARSQ
jgi:formylglycine-generating enzyme required for sulfatase activity